MSALSVRHVLLATDFSPASARARRLAIDLAQRTGAALTALHVLEPIGYPYWIPQLDSVRSGVEREFDAYLETLRTAVPEVRSSLRDGVPSVEIVDAAKELAADVIVMGTHGRTGVRHAMMGSVAEKVVRSSAVPVLTVTSWRFEDLRAGAARLSTMLSVAPRSVLVGVGRAGAILAAHLASAKVVTADALLTAPMLHGREVSGLVAEDGTELLHRWAPIRPESIPGNAREIVGADASALREDCPRVLVAGRPVVVVCDRADMLALELSADVVRKAGASEVRAALAVADEESLAAAKPLVDEVIVGEIVPSKEELDCAFRDEGRLSIGVVRKHLLATRARDAAVANIYGTG